MREVKVQALRDYGEAGVRQEEGVIRSLHRDHGQRIAVVEFSDGVRQEVPVQFVNDGIGW